MHTEKIKDTESLEITAEELKDIKEIVERLGLFSNTNNESDNLFQNADDLSFLNGDGVGYSGDILPNKQRHTDTKI